MRHKQIINKTGVRYMIVTWSSSIDIIK